MAASDQKLQYRGANIPGFLTRFHALAVKIPMKYFIKHEK